MEELLLDKFRLRLEDGRLYTEMKKYTQAEGVTFDTLRPDNFGVCGYFINETCRSKIDEFLKKYIRPNDYFKYAWNEFHAKLDLDYCKEYYREEVGIGVEPTSEEFMIIAELYVASFPFLANRHRNEFFLYDGYYGLSDINLPPSKALAARSLKEYVQGVFGSYRKDAKNLALELSNNTLFVISKFSKFMDLNHIVTTVNEEREHLKSSVDMPFDDVDLNLLSLLSAGSQKRLFRDALINSSEVGYIAKDTINMLGVVQEDLDSLRNIKDWKDLHNRVMKLAPEVDENYKIKIPSSIEKLNDYALNDLTFSSLKFGGDYTRVGDLLDNCLGKSDYMFKSLRHESYCFEVLKAGVTYAAMEIAYYEKTSSWKILQLRGKENCIIEETKAVMEGFEELFERKLVRANS